MAWNGSDQTSSGAPRRRGLQAASPRAPQSNNPKSQIKQFSPSHPTSTSHFDSRLRLRLLTSTLLLALLALAGAALWYFLRPAPPPPNPTIKQSNNPTIQTVTPRPARTNKVAKAEKPKPEPVAKPAPAPKKNLGHVTYARTEKTGRVMTLMDGTVVTNFPRVIFKRDFEKSLMVALRPGNMGSCLLATIRARYTDDQIVKMLQEMTVPEAGDDETATACKNNVQSLKERMLLEIRSGRSVSDVLDEIQQQCGHESLMVAEAHKLRTEAIRSGDETLIRNAVNGSNKVLGEMGIQPLSAPAGVDLHPEAAAADGAEAETGAAGAETSARENVTETND